MAGRSKALIALIALAAAVLLFLAFREVVINERDYVIRMLETGKRPAQAREVLERALIKNPDDIEAQGWMLLFEIEDGRINRVESRLQVLEMKAPDNYTGNKVACVWYLKSGRIFNAKKACGRAVEQSDGDPEDLERLAAVHMEVNHWKDALPILLEAVRKAPRDARVLNSLGYCYLGMYKYKEAISYLQRAISADPYFLEARKNLSRVYYSQGRFRQAVAELEKVLEIDPEDKDAISNLIVIYSINLNDPERAESYMLRARALGFGADMAQRLKKLSEDRKAGPQGR